VPGELGDFPSALPDGDGEVVRDASAKRR